MESSAVMVLYKCSPKRCKLYYDPFTGDADCSAYQEISNGNAYRVTKPVHKEEDTGHVTKHMGNQLRALVRDWRGKKLSNGKIKNGKRRLTNNCIYVFQNLYGFCNTVK